MFDQVVAVIRPFLLPARRSSSGHVFRFRRREPGVMKPRQELTLKAVSAVIEGDFSALVGRAHRAQPGSLGGRL